MYTKWVAKEFPFSKALAAVRVVRAVRMYMPYILRTQYYMGAVGVCVCRRMLDGTKPQLDAAVALRTKRAAMIHTTPDCITPSIHAGCLTRESTTKVILAGSGGEARQGRWLGRSRTGGTRYR